MKAYLICCISLHCIARHFDSESDVVFSVEDIVIVFVCENAEGNDIMINRMSHFLPFHIKFMKQAKFKACFLDII